MASERFYRLPPEKQQDIQDAAIEEFARVPFEKVSINKIIQKAGISRGSFYTYFEDSRDLLKYILEDIFIRTIRYCQEFMENNHGDYWAMMDGMLERGMNWYISKNFRELIKNAMVQQDFDPCIWSTGLEDDIPKTPGEFCQWLFDHGNWKNTRISTVEDIRVLTETHMAAVLAAIGQADEKPEEKEAILKRYHMKVNMLKYGIFTETKEDESVS